MPILDPVVDINRRTFVGASVAVGGAVATGPLVASCGDDGTSLEFWGESYSADEGGFATVAASIVP